MRLLATFAFLAILAAGCTDAQLAAYRDKAAAAQAGAEKAAAGLDSAPAKAATGIVAAVNPAAGAVAEGARIGAREVCEGVAGLLAALQAFFAWRRSAKKSAVIKVLSNAGDKTAGYGDQVKAALADSSLSQTDLRPIHAAAKE